MTSHFVPSNGLKLSSSVFSMSIYGILSFVFTCLSIYLILGQGYGRIFKYQSKAEYIISLAFLLIWTLIFEYFFERSAKDLRDAKEMEEIIKEERCS